MRQPGFIKRKPRACVSKPAELLRADGSIWPVVITDLSDEGFRLQVEETPTIGETVELKVLGFDLIEAQIRWAFGNAAGGRFSTPAEPD